MNSTKILSEIKHYQKSLYINRENAIKNENIMSKFIREKNLGQAYHYLKLCNVFLEKNTENVKILSRLLKEYDDALTKESNDE